MSIFRTAKRQKAKLRLALCGPAGSGKTYSSLLIAQGLSGKIVLVDTEHGSGELYSDLTDYDIFRMELPFAPSRLIKVIEEAEKEKYGVLIIDSLSHFWMGEGGVLQEVDNITMASKSKNAFTTGWRKMSPEHNKLVDKLLSSNLHLIITLRTKTAYDVSKDERGKTQISKVGLEPIQRAGIEYEFTTVWDLSTDDHMAASTKDRTGLFDGRAWKPSSKDGKLLLQWLESGVEVPEGTVQQAEKFFEQEATNETKNEFQKEAETDNAHYQKVWDKLKEAKATPHVGNILRTYVEAANVPLSEEAKRKLREVGDKRKSEITAARKEQQTEGK